MYNAEKIKELIKGSLSGAEVEVHDLTGGGDHFQAVVIWSGFEGMSVVKQHQTVMVPLQEGLKGAIHALQIKTRAKK